MSKDVTRVVLWGLLGVFVILPLGMRYGPQYLTNMTVAAVKANAPSAADATCSAPINHVCPANANKLDEQARQRQQATSATTIPVPQPYGPANGPIRPLPSVRPVAPAEPTGGRPQLGDAPEGGLIGKIPEIGKALEGGLKEIAPVASP